MPELPDVLIYAERLQALAGGHALQKITLNSPFLLRTFEPPVSALIGQHLKSVDLIGKRIVLEFEADLFLVFHLMIAGRLHWTAAGAKPLGRKGLAKLEFDNGALTLTEAGTQRRASLHLVGGEAALAEFDRGGLDVMEADREQFAEALRCENHTVKRSLTDPRLLSGIGNSYSDEILHRAKLSPMLLTQKMTEDEIDRLFAATRATLSEWIERLRAQAGHGFPEKVTAFRDEMAVHGRFGQPCPVCGTAVQRIVYASNETNYCPRCQTGGKLLADRSLSRLLKSDWPRSIDEL